MDKNHSLNEYAISSKDSLIKDLEVLIESKIKHNYDKYQISLLEIIDTKFNILKNKFEVLETKCSSSQDNPIIEASFKKYNDQLVEIRLENSTYGIKLKQMIDSFANSLDTIKTEKKTLTSLIEKNKKNIKNFGEAIDKINKDYEKNIFEFEKIKLEVNQLCENAKIYVQDSKNKYRPSEEMICFNDNRQSISNLKKKNILHNSSLAELQIYENNNINQLNGTKNQNCFCNILSYKNNINEYNNVNDFNFSDTYKEEDIKFNKITKKNKFNNSTENSEVDQLDTNEIVNQIVKKDSKKECKNKEDIMNMNHTSSFENYNNINININSNSNTDKREKNVKIKSVIGIKNKNLSVDIENSIERIRPRSNLTNTIRNRLSIKNKKDDDFIEKNAKINYIDLKIGNKINPADKIGSNEVLFLNSKGPFYKNFALTNNINYTIHNKQKVKNSYHSKNNYRGYSCSERLSQNNIGDPANNSMKVGVSSKHENNKPNRYYKGAVFQNGMNLGKTNYSANSNLMPNITTSTKNIDNSHDINKFKINNTKNNLLFSRLKKSFNNDNSANNTNANNIINNNLISCNKNEIKGYKQDGKKEGGQKGNKYFSLAQIMYNNNSSSSINENIKIEDNKK